MGAKSVTVGHTGGVVPYSIHFREIIGGVGVKIRKYGSIWPTKYRYGIIFAESFYCNGSPKFCHTFI